MGQSQSLLARNISLLKRVLAREHGSKAAVLEHDQLASVARPLCAAQLEQLGYQGTPQPSNEQTEALLELMYKRAVLIGVPLNDPLSSKGFRLGHSLALLAYPGHPVHIQAHIGLLTWLVVQYDDIVGQGGQMLEAAGGFHERFFRGEPQPNPLLEGMAMIIREAADYYDPVLVTLLQVSVLRFITSNLLEQRPEFKSMPVTKAGAKFPYYFRDMAGMDVCYAVFCYPKTLYPDIGQYVEAIPDMAIFINVSNDVLSFYKEELEGEKKNYITNKAVCEQRNVLDVLEEVNKETVASAKRAQKILKGRGVYAKSWDDCVRGFTAMHTTNPRYRLAELGLGEEHPLKGIKDKVEQLLS